MPAPDGTTSTGPVLSVLPPQSAPTRKPPRLSFDPALSRRGAVDGAWWPESRNATAELPGLIAGLDSRPGVHVRRLSVHIAEWDDIPRRLRAGGNHVIRVDWFTTIPRHTISVTADGNDTISLLVIPPGTAAAPAQAALDTAMSSLGSPDGILAAAQQAPA
jgi:Family of unknown function (DUF5994)